MSKNKISLVVVGSILVLATVFYGGMKYQSSKNIISNSNFTQRSGGQFASSTNRGGVRGNFSGMLNGKIITISDNILTVSDQTGGSRIVFLSASTTVSKMLVSINKDLIVGANVLINGASNSDNSINAQTIQIRP